MLNFSDRELVSRVTQGDEEAFAWVVRRYQGVMFNVAYRLLGNRREAEDATQEAFIRAYQAMPSFDLTRPLSPWLKRITTNLCLNWLEKERARPQITVSELTAPDDEVGALEQFPAPQVSPEQQVSEMEQGQRIRSALRQLPVRYRVVIELRHYQELSYEEIAAALDIPVSTVKSDLFRARKQLGERLESKL
ncbi:MAG: sigma-70 family RNA polymerase sigma factor [Anaerolineae bacterium]|nr:sigma-70 family RNA polymerase sigma factor [Anaerolineae bacterium]